MKSINWNTKRKSLVETTFENFREKLRNKIFDRKFNNIFNDNINMNIQNEFGKIVSFNIE
jgi:hypothetical protein